MAKQMLSCEASSSLLLVVLISIVVVSRGALVTPSLCLRGGAYSGKFDEVTKASDVILRDHKARTKSPPTEIEKKVSETMFEGMKADPALRMLKYLHVMSVQEVPVPASNERALVLIVPFIEMKEYRKIQEPLQDYLEQHFQAHVVLIQHRRVLPKEKQGHRLLKQKRPMSRTLTFVHKAWLEDIIHPYDICAEHHLYTAKSDKPVAKIYLDPKEREKCEGKLEMYAAVYKHLTGKIAVFDFLMLREGSELQKQRAPNKYPCDTAGFTISEVPPKPLIPPAADGDQDYASPPAIEAEERVSSVLQGAVEVVHAGA